MRPNRPETVFRMLLSEFTDEGNHFAKEAVGTTNPQDQEGFLAGRERERWRDFPGRFVIGGGSVTVRAAGAAGLGAGAKRFVDDGLDGARAPAAFGAATEAAIDLLWIARQIPGRADGIADIVVADDVTGTDNHETGRTLR